MFMWWVSTVFAGTPSHLGASDLDAFIDDVGDRTELLETAISRRLADLNEPTLAREARQLLAPAVERLGLQSQRAPLEDRSFALLEPVDHAGLVAQLPTAAVDQATLLALRDDLQTLAGPQAEITGRIKSLWSTHRKLVRKDIPLDELHDRIALRVVLPDEEACYGLLDRLVDRYDVVENELDDYIASPKPSGYQALHLAVRTSSGSAEIQVKTQAMHHAAEHGDAAHWRYKLT